MSNIIISNHEFDNLEKFGYTSTVTSTRQCEVNENLEVYDENFSRKLNVIVLKITEQDGKLFQTFMSKTK